MRSVKYITLILAVLIFISLDGMGFRNDAFATGGKFGPVVKPQYIPDDRCEEALKVKPVKISESGQGEKWQYKEEYRWFTNGSNEDDWYAYTTTKDSEWESPGEVKFKVQIESEDINILSVGVYQTCDSWPIKYAAKTQEEQSITPRTGNTKYYFHVNLLAPPNDKKAVKYSITIIEEYVDVPD
jgi:hypothetical protein